MITIKTHQEIEIMREGGQILKRVMAELLPSVRPGITTKEINQKAEALIVSFGAEASFKTVKNYPWATCLPVNQQIVHTPPSEKILRDGDLLTVDIGVYYKGYHTDYATSYIVGSSANPAIAGFLRVGASALQSAVDQARVGKYIRDISQTIFHHVNTGGYHVIKELTGHGIGKKLHEDPLIPGYVLANSDQKIKLVPGMTLAIEVIYAVGTDRLKPESGSEWSLVTSDGSLSACFEKTIAVTENKPFILT